MKASYIETSYYGSPSPQFDAVEDVIGYFGRDWTEVNREAHRWTQLYSQMTFVARARMLGITGFAVMAWFESIQGQGKWMLPVSGMESLFRQMELGK